MNWNLISEAYSSQARDLPGRIASLLGSMKSLASVPCADEEWLRRKVSSDYASELEAIHIMAENVAVYVRVLGMILAEKGGTR